MSTAEVNNPPTPSSDLGDRIACLAAEATVREHQLIRAIGDFEASGQWATEGAISCAQWLSWRIGMSAVASRERVRVAKALAELPKIDAAFAEARLSFSKVRALTRVTNKDNEAELLEIGLAATATQCERICRTFRKVMAPGTGAEVEAKRRVSVREGDDGTVRVSVVLPADEGARFVASMDAAREVLDRDAHRDEARTRHSRADGLMALVEGWFSSEMRPRRGGAPNEVVLHVNADALRRSDVPAGTLAGASSAESSTNRTPGSSRAPVEHASGRVHAGVRGARTEDVPAGTQAPPCACTALEAPVAILNADTTDALPGDTAPARDVPSETPTTPSRSAAHETPAAVLTADTTDALPGDTAPTLVVPAGTPAGSCACTAPARGGARRKAETATPTPRVPAGTQAVGCDCSSHQVPARSEFAYIDNLGGVGVDHETARRLACDASLVTIVEGLDGEALDVGRKRRTVPPAITRALEARHGRKCAFPGCEHTLFLDHHHIEHWADGGETKVDNLMLLCRHHHTFVHEHGWTIEQGADGPTFIAPSGRRVEAAPRLGPVDLVALQDDLPERAAERALCATGGWELIDYPEIIHALAEATVRGARRAEAGTYDRAPGSNAAVAETASEPTVM